MRCFIAIDIDAEIRSRIEKIQNDLKKRLNNSAGIKWVKPQLIHLTLKFLGEVEDENAELIIESLEQACKEIKKFELEFSKLGSFGRPPKVLWLGMEKQCGELEKLVQNIEVSVESLGFQREERPFSPHLTIARIKDGAADRNLPQIIENFGSVNMPVINVDTVCFYKSQLPLHLPNIHKNEKKEGAGLTSDSPIYTLLRKINLI
jgi:2'-5' RNA ligase